MMGLNMYIGLPLVSIGRCADMAWFAFGKERTIITSSGKARTITEASLHVQCDFELWIDNKKVLEHSDIHMPSKCNNENSHNLLENGNCIFDEKAKIIVASLGNKYNINTIDISNNGNLSIGLPDNSKLITIRRDDLDEQWRMFSPYSDNPHFVMEGHKLKEQ